LTSVTESVPGTAVVNWDATGSFPSGFKILYSKTHSTPTLSDSKVLVSNGALRTGTFSGTLGAKYYVRVCKYLNSACVVYSNVMTITFTGPTATVDGSTISITSIRDTADGNATVHWSDSGSFPTGFNILISKTNPTPTPADNDGFVNVSGSSATSGTITGTAGSTYYVRVCKDESGDCGNYSSVTTFTFAKITMDPATESSPGVGSFTWTDAGDFSHGFALIYAVEKTVTDLASADGYVTPISGSALSKTISGTPQVIPGTTIHYRLCQLTASSTCAVYSNEVTITYAAEIILSLDALSTPGHMLVGWNLLTATPSSGYKILRGNGSVDPIIDNTIVGTVPNTDNSFDDNPVGGSGTQYVYRVCGFDGTHYTSCSAATGVIVP
jgi:hypothetical protein